MPLPYAYDIGEEMEEIDVIVGMIDGEERNNSFTIEFNGEDETL